MFFFVLFFSWVISELIAKNNQMKIKWLGHCSYFFPKLLEYLVIVVLFLPPFETRQQPRPGNFRTSNTVYFDSQLGSCSQSFPVCTPIPHGAARARPARRRGHCVTFEGRSALWSLFGALACTWPCLSCVLFFSLFGRNNLEFLHLSTSVEVFCFKLYGKSFIIALLLSYGPKKFVWAVSEISMILK